jgi:hypothetical protein
MPKNHPGWGGRRVGSGGKPLPLSKLRRNRVIAMLTDEEFSAVRAYARSRKQPLATAVRDLIVASVKEK